MDLISYLKNFKDFDSQVIINLSDTWGGSLLRLLSSSKSDIEKYLEKRKYLTYQRQNIYEAKWESVVSEVNEYLSDKKIIGFHCARLMDCEIDDVLSKGLRPLTNDLVHKKINLVYNLGMIPIDLKEKLLQKDEYNEESNRRNKVHITHNLLTLRHEMGLYKLLKIWGGEAIYTGFEDNPYLQRIGTPCIIVAEVEYRDLIYLDISQRLISIFVENSYFYDHEFDSEIPHNVKVLSVIKKENKLFNQLTNSHSWHEKIS